MEIKSFASKHRLKTKVDDCGDTIVAGKTGDIYTYNATELGAMYLPKKESARTWGNLKRQAEPIGMKLRQNGDTEGAFSFDPTNKAHVKLALRIAGARPKRKVSPEQKAALVQRLASGRSKAAVEVAQGA